MDWKDLGKKIAGFGLPLLANAILPGSGAAVAAVTAALGLPGDSAPDTISKAIDADPEAATKLAQIEADKTVELARIVAQQAMAERQADSADTAQVNETMRAELAAPSGYRAGWRPLFGYMIALSIGGLFAALIHAIWVAPADTVKILEAAANLIVFSLAVLGVSVKKRSDDKAAALGDRPLGIFEAVASRIAK